GLGPAQLGLFAWALLAGAAARYLSGVPNKRIFRHYPVIVAAILTAQSAIGLSAAISLSIAAFLAAEALTQPRKTAPEKMHESDAREVSRRQFLGAAAVI